MAVSEFLLSYGAPSPCEGI